MLKTLLPYIKLYRHYVGLIILGVVLVLMALGASIFLLSLSGWFLSATAFVGVAGLYTFNYMLPAAGVRGAAIIRTAARYFERLVNHNTTFKILSYLRTTAFQKILPLSALQLQQYQKADLLNRFIADIDHLDHLYLRLFMPIISGLLITAAIYFSLSYFDQTVALVITLILLATILAVPLIFYQAGKSLGGQITQQQREYRQSLVSYLQGQAELTLFNARSHYRQRLDAIEQNWLLNQKKQANLLSLSTALILLIIGFMTLLIISLTANGIANFDRPIIALFIFLGLSCTEILAPIPGAFLFLGQVLGSAKRMNELMEQSPDIIFPDDGKVTDMTRCNIKIDDLAFTYPNQPFHVFEAVNVTIKQGEHIALIGKTGCGKSTLLSLFTRAWQPTKGNILLNDININQFDESTLRQLIVVIPQVITIFSDTLRNNLLIGNQHATDEQLIDVLRSVELDKLIESRDGLNLWLGESGRALSGGEKRRIGIARALLHNAPLVLMDEPTESLDAQTEQQILAILEKCYSEKTLILVTHRLIQNTLFDRTLMLENRQLTEVSAN
ncbi:ATP-binding cassette subfamily C protein CydC [Orbus hercynius]|uniref:ATP-binding cassette subfamily C protein CydC n=1 Tax=Orbus hercynius TaxID=593135 RepID=A0A495RD78_9GAMM|nr:cysteine/glutathione ABC transporter ATP-binding protein/permease CydC [Orbus hercynius]RKS85230.1 ATP-binding cassette subfamily C protein CydC [Orbus hercynius]